MFEVSCNNRIYHFLKKPLKIFCVQCDILMKLKERDCTVHVPFIEVVICNVSSMRVQVQVLMLLSHMSMYELLCM